MKVVHLNYSDSDTGGAIAVHRLHKGLERVGVDSTMMVSHKGTDDPKVIVFQPPTDLATRIRRHLRRRQIRWSFDRYPAARSLNSGSFTDNRCPHGTDALAQIPPTDILHLHVARHLIDFGALFSKRPQRVPVVQTLHDMSFFTGGCQCNAGCEKYTERCGPCPQLGSGKENDLSRQIWQRKHSILSRVMPRHLNIVTPSRWLAKEAERSTLLRNFKATVIPLAIDTQIFHPIDRSFAREVLGIPHDASVVLFVAEPITWPTKGFSLLVQALNGLSHLTNLFLIAAGSGKPPGEIRFPHLYLSHIGNERLMSLVYSAADIFVIPSLQDNFPQTALEATACGIPVIGFAVGGIPEIVRPGITGCLVPPQDVIALRGAISDLLQNPTRRAEMAIHCRQTAVKEYDLPVQAKSYRKLYREILSRQRPGSAPAESGSNAVENAPQVTRPADECQSACD